MLFPNSEIQFSSSCSVPPINVYCKKRLLGNNDSGVEEILPLTDFHGNSVSKMGKGVVEMFSLVPHSRKSDVTRIRGFSV